MNSNTVLCRNTLMVDSVTFWNIANRFMITADSFIFNSKHNFMIAYMVYINTLEKQTLITEDILENPNINCSDASARAFIHNLKDLKYIEITQCKNDKRKKTIIATDKLINAFDINFYGPS